MACPSAIRKHRSGKEKGLFMSQILNLSEHTTDDELQRLTTLLLFHLVERCGGQVQFRLEDAQRVRANLTTKMVQMQVGDEVRLRIIDRLPELQ